MKTFQFIAVIFSIYTVSITILYPESKGLLSFLWVFVGVFTVVSVVRGEGK